jgi:pyridoxamine 5'-phosphate oxidase family protein
MFTEGEIEYLAAQPLARLATVQPNGTLQNNPVAFYYNTALQAIDIGGRNMPDSRKFKNVAANGRVALVVDDIASFDPWVVRCLEIRGRGEPIADPADSAARAPGAIIRVHPERIVSWGIDPPHLSRGKRNVSDPPAT